MKSFYRKTNYTPEQHIDLLKQRGLIVEDESKTLHYLSNIGYFRLSAYFYPLLQLPKEEHRYKAGSTFKQVMDMYRFDRKLRLLLFNEIEKIEVAIRSTIVNIVCHELNSPFWITEQSSYSNQERYHSTLQLINNEYSKSKEDFIVHFKESYADVYPPAWMLAEILSLGTLCNVYNNLRNNQIKKIIARKFGLQPPVFSSWITILCQVRNMCCHHARTWNRELLVIPMEPKKNDFKWITPHCTDKKRMYYRICMIRYMLFPISPNNGLKENLISLCEQYPKVDIRAMGFPAQWSESDFWL